MRATAWSRKPPFPSVWGLSRSVREPSVRPTEEPNQQQALFLARKRTLLVIDLRALCSSLTAQMRSRQTIILPPTNARRTISPVMRFSSRRFLADGSPLLRLIVQEPLLKRGERPPIDPRADRKRSEDFCPELDHSESATRLQNFPQSSQQVTKRFEEYQRAWIDLNPDIGHSFFVSCGTNRGDARLTQ